MGSIPTASTIALYMRRFKIGILTVTVALLVGVPSAPAQEINESLEFRFAGSSVMVPRFGAKVELLPVLQLLGAEAAFSPAAGTYGVKYQDRLIQFSPGRRYVLIDETLEEFEEVPVASPGGVAASLRYLDRVLLSPLGYHLEAAYGGYQIMTGARYADPVEVRAAAADFGATTTLVLTLNRSTPAEVSSAGVESAVVHFDDASPHLDETIPLRSRRAKRMTTQGQDLILELNDGIGVVSWHTLDDPPRVIVELGAVRPTPTPAPERFRPRTRVAEPPIVIDPGHGGDDIGAVSSAGTMEKDLMLQVALRLETILEGRGHAVRLTRSGDNARALTDRTALANRLEAEVFVSLHANASHVGSVRGAETYYMSLEGSATDDAAAAMAELENQGSDEGSVRSPLDLILWDLAQADVLNDSADLALAVQRRLNNRLGLRDRGVKQAPFVVLTGATMPAVLIEVGFLSNADEAGKLTTPEHQQRVAEAIALGVEDFLGSQ
ncbi:MAG: N-acetylmuramoyl-L-alanine amidase [bacterium]|nr:N-acetylmuramoyl-L-alanine amidase [bacterium]